MGGIIIGLPLLIFIIKKISECASRPTVPAIEVEESYDGRKPDKISIQLTSLSSPARQRHARSPRSPELLKSSK